MNRIIGANETRSESQIDCPFGAVDPSNNAVVRIWSSVLVANPPEPTVVHVPAENPPAVLSSSFSNPGPAEIT